MRGHGTKRYERRRSDEIVSVEPRVFDLIARFAANPDKVLSLESLVEDVWQDRIVSDVILSRVSRTRTKRCKTPTRLGNTSR